MKQMKKIAAAISGMLIFLSVPVSFPAHAAIMIGDANNDGAVDILDVITINRAVLGKELLDEVQTKAADLDKNGVVDAADSLYVLKYLVELIDFPEDNYLMTSEDICELAKKGDDLTWADFEQYQSEDIGSGQYMLKYEIADNDEFYLLVCGGTKEGKPDSILIESTDGENIDIRSEEVQQMVKNPFWWWVEPENDEVNRASAKQIGEYALKGLQNGTYTLETKISVSNAPELISDETAEVLYQDDICVFTYLSFVDEHTVLLRMNKGLLDAYGYLITDESVTFSEGEYVSVPNEHYDGDLVYIDWAGDHLYYFWAGT